MREVKGPRSDLTRVRGPGEITVLHIEGRVDSLAGIERMTSLEVLIIDRDGDPELARLTGLKQLVDLSVFTKTDADFSTLGALTSLEELRVRCKTQRSALSLANADLSGLQRVQVLELHVAREWGVSLDTSWMSRAPLSGLELVGFALSDESFEHVAALEGLRQLAIEPLSEERAAVLREIRNDPRIRATPEPVSILGTVIEFEGQSPRFSLALECAERWGLENEYEAAERLQELVEARDPGLAARLTWDPTADEIWIRAERREDLEAVKPIAEQG